jgi:hypothetical protein
MLKTLILAPEMDALAIVLRNLRDNNRLLHRRRTEFAFGVGIVSVG